MRAPVSPCAATSHALATLVGDFLCVAARIHLPHCWCCAPHCRSSPSKLLESSPLHRQLSLAFLFSMRSPSRAPMCCITEVVFIFLISDVPVSPKHFCSVPHFSDESLSNTSKSYCVSQPDLQFPSLNFKFGPS